MVLKALRTVEARGTYETARRLKVMIGALMRYGVSIGWADSDPTPTLRGTLARPQQKPHAAVTDPKACGELLRAIDGYSRQPSTRIGLQLLALLYPSPGELRFAKWHEFDLERRVWTIPAERTTLRRASGSAAARGYRPSQRAARFVRARRLSVSVDPNMEEADQRRGVHRRAAPHGISGR
jgi:integrase